ncbi:MAG: matrixin family metalloprotease [Flavobacterium sp.]
MKELKILLTGFVLVLSSCHSDESNIIPKSISPEDGTALICTFDLRESLNNPTSKPNAAIINWHWQTGQTVKIKFLDGDIAWHETVKRVASEWTNYANLKFEYVGINQYADIRIGFHLTGKENQYGGWSVLGAQTAYMSQDRQTMRLGPLTGAEDSIRRTILHEFGHALGLFHETTNPAADIQWDLPKTYKYYSLQFTKDQVDRFIINKENAWDYSEYDPLSIMHYYIPSFITTNGVGVSVKSELSMTDIVFINKWHPFPIRSIVESGERIDFIPWQHSVKSPNGKYELHFFNNGSLSIIDLATNTFVWDVGNHGTYNKQTSCHLEANGNLIIRGARTHTLGATKYTAWSSNTTTFPGAKLHLQNDGNLVLIYNGLIKWSSKLGKL